MRAAARRLGRLLRALVARIGHAVAVRVRWDHVLVGADVRRAFVRARVAVDVIRTEQPVRDPSVPRRGPGELVVIPVGGVDEARRRRLLATLVDDASTRLGTARGGLAGSPVRAVYVECGVAGAVEPTAARSAREPTAIRFLPSRVRCAQPPAASGAAAAEIPTESFPRASAVRLRRLKVTSFGPLPKRPIATAVELAPVVRATLSRNTAEPSAFASKR